MMTAWVPIAGRRFPADFPANVSSAFDPPLAAAQAQSGSEWIPFSWAMPVNSSATISHDFTEIDRLQIQLFPSLVRPGKSRSWDTISEMDFIFR